MVWRLAGARRFPVLTWIRLQTRSSRMDWMATIANASLISIRSRWDTIRVLRGIIVAIVLAILSFFRPNWWPHGTVLGEVPEMGGW
jgi:hypothetical protein